MIIGLVVCNQLGFFAGENIPEFLISQKEIWNTYPSLLAAAPSNLNETEEVVNESMVEDDEEWNPSIDHLLNDEEE